MPGELLELYLMCRTSDSPFRSYERARRAFLDRRGLGGQMSPFGDSFTAYVRALRSLQGRPVRKGRQGPMKPWKTASNAVELECRKCGRWTEGRAGGRPICRTCYEKVELEKLERDRLRGGDR